MKKIKQKNEPVREVADRLHSAAIHLLRRVRKQDTVMAQAPAQLSALSVVVFGGPMRLGQLAAAEQVKPPTMTRIVQGLERSGLAERVGDAEDARRVKIHATAKGVRLMQKGREARISALVELLRGLEDSELEALVRATNTLERVLHQGS